MKLQNLGLACTFFFVASSCSATVEDIFTDRDPATDDVAVTKHELKGVTAVWTSQGPTVINGGQVENLTDGTEPAGAPANNPVTGAVQRVVADPTNSDILYVGAVNGGIWRTGNALSTPPTWTNQTPDFPSLSIGALAMDPANVTGLVAGIGSYSAYGGSQWNDTRAGGPLNGLMVSFDGTTWNQIVPTPGMLVDQHVSGAVIRNSTNPAATTLVVSAQELTTFNIGTFADGGVFISNDTGLSWRRACRPADVGVDPACTAGGLPVRGMFTLVEDPATPTRLYAAAAGGLPANTFGVFVSDDTGLNWTHISVNSPALQQTIDALDGAGTPLNNNTELAVGQGGRVYAVATLNGVPAYIGFSDDQGLTWTEMDLPLVPSVNPTLTGTVMSAQPSAGLGSPIDITTAVNHNLPTRNDIGVRIQGVVGNVAANGDWQIDVQSPTVFRLIASASLAGCGGVGQPTCGAAAQYSAFNSSNPRPKAGAQGAIHLSLIVDPTTDTIVYLGGDRQNESGTAGNYIGASTASAALWRGNTTQASSVPQLIPSPQWEHLGHSRVCNAPGCFTPALLPPGWPGAGQIPNGGTAAATGAVGAGSAGHADSRGFAFMNNGNLVEVGDAGVVMRTNPRNNTGDWFSLNGNLQVTEAHDIAFDAVSGIVMIGNQDTGAAEQTATGSWTWRAIQLADGGDVAVDDTQLVFPGVSIRYSSFQNLGNFRREAFNAANASVPAPAGSQPNGLVEACPVGAVPPCLTANPPTSPVAPQFKTPLAINAAFPLAMLIGGNANIWESFNQGANVAAVASPLPQTTAFELVYGHPGNPWLIYAVTAAAAWCPAPGSQLLVRTAAPGSGTPDATLTNVSGVAGAPPAAFQAFDVAVDPGANPETAYVVGANCVAGALSTPAVWRFTVTSIAGQAITGTWTNLTGDLGQLSPGTIRTAAYVPAGAGPNDKIVIGGDNGVYMTTDPATTPTPSGNVFWNEVGADSLPNARVFDMEYETTNDTVYVATMGRGTFSLANMSTTNMPPYAECQAMPALLPADASCQATVTTADIDNGSFDPDGHAVTLSVLNPGPYTLGVYNTTLQVTSSGGVETCNTMAVVYDDAFPTNVVAPPPIVLTTGGNVNETILDPDNLRSASDNCTGIVWRTVPPMPANLPLGPNTVQWFASDTFGNENPVPALQDILVLGGDAQTTGDSFSCELTGSGDVTCWGYGGDGRLGDGTNETRWAGGVVTLSGATQLSVGTEHACAVLSDGTARCWGENNDGRLGTGNGFGDAETPVQVAGLTTVEQISAGDSHTCAVLSNGELYCWGENDSGRLGIGYVFGDQEAPQQVTALSNAAQVSAGGAHTCAVLDNGDLYCWGENANGRLGIGYVFGDQDTPQQVTALSDVKQVSAAEAHTCAVTNSGQLFCWGRGADGRLGIGWAFDQDTPQPVVLPAAVAQVSAGTAHTCAVLVTGEAYCWGEDSDGRLGIGQTTQDAITPQLVLGFDDVVQVSAGEKHTCAVRANGQQICWGDNLYGQLGNGTSGDSDIATMVAGLCDPALVSTGALDMGRDFGCARALMEGEQVAYCWGDNNQGQLGTGDEIDRRAPWPIESLTGVSVVSAGDYHACATLFSGELYCWGLGDDGRLGDGSGTSSEEPSQVFTAPPTAPGSDCFYREEAGRGYYFCQDDESWEVARDNCRATGMELARIDTQEENDFVERFVSTTTWIAGNDRDVEGEWRWAEGGVDNGDQFWSGPSALFGGTAILYSNWDNFFEPGGGGSSNCAYTDTTGGWYDGFCTTGRSYVCEGAAASVPDAMRVSAGASHTCATTLAGSVLCWGDNLEGALGDGTNQDRETPVSVVGLPASWFPVEVAAGGSHSCALLVHFVTGNLTVFCWGENGDGELGDGSFNDSDTAVQVQGLPQDIVDIKAGRDHTCALSATGQVFCWGEGSYGQLGLGDLFDRNTAQEVLDSGASLVASSISAGNSHTCAVEAGRTLCWGAGGSGRLGNGSSFSRDEPVEVSSLADAVAVSAGDDHTCATRSDGMESEVVCWGSNGDGELGDGTTGSSSVPVATGGQSCF